MLVTSRNIDNVTVWTAEAESLGDLVQWLQVTPATWAYGASTRSVGGYEWDLGAGWSKTLELARDGWQQGVKDLSDRLAVAMPHLKADAKWRYDVAGERPDIGRFVSGDPACMMRHGHPKGHRPVISIVVPICVAASVSAKCMVNYGAAMVAIIDKLEHAGRRVELLAGWGNLIHSGQRVAGTWVVKNAEDALDLSAVAFSLGHPAASRRLGFAIVERCPFRQNSSYGCGMSQFNLTERDFTSPAPTTFYVPGLKAGECNTLDEALVFVRNQINAAAGETLVTLED